MFWRVYTPLHPAVRSTAERCGITSDKFVRHRRKGRQDYLLGHIAPGVSVEEFVNFLIAQGFGNHFIAWHDEGEVASLRLVENFVYQYHLRVFEDGEVRGHYEFTPECYPIMHLRGVGQEERADFFLRLLGDKITPAEAGE